MKILVVGGGGREHAIVDALSKCPEAEKIYCAPGNAGIAAQAECVSIGAKDIPALVAFAKDNQIDLTVVGMDDPLMLGIVDAFEEAGLRVFGPRKNAAVLEGSKVFSKNLMKKYGIPTAAYEEFSDSEAAKAYIKANKTYPIVLKADGLALGKGVLICADEAEALAGIDEIMVDRKFGEAGSRLVIEEFMTGPEVSVLSFCDGETVVPMVSAQDHKRAFDGDQGLNTGGMGTFSPSRYYTEDIAAVCRRTIFDPTVKAMKAEGRTFKGIIYFGLMLTKDGPKVLEYNARFGDPEAQVVLPRLSGNFVQILNACIDGNLTEEMVTWKDNAAVCVVLASGGYPVSYGKGYPIHGLHAFDGMDGMCIYHAGTAAKEDGTIVTNGGRVLDIVATAPTLAEAIQKVYSHIDEVGFEKAFYRHDIGVK
ncbi:MAG: phosphoribosylamine--glycine ligase [Firmicutes bacterium]|nr:phosphoribosylamine--glycine ligase [Bacillota bacterium]